MSCLIDAFAARGVKHAVVSPGSRSAPIALALERNPSIEVHVILDERSAAFFALGLAKCSGEHVLVAATSGTAVANWLPAFVEAHYSGVGLVGLSADRPARLRNTGANQTIDQSRILETFAKCFDACPESGFSTDELYSLTTQVLAPGETGAPRPAQLNIELDEPLLPAPDEVYGVQNFENATHEGEVSHSKTVPDAFRELVVSGASGVVVAGTLDYGDTSISELAKQLGWPLLAEPTSGLRNESALKCGVALASRMPTPDVVLQFGSTPTSGPVLEMCASARNLLIVDPHGRISDPAANAHATANAPDAYVTSELMPPSLVSSAWSKTWAAADKVVSGVVDQKLTIDQSLFEPAIARAIGWFGAGPLYVGASMPVRDLDAFMPPREDTRVLSNRGASGIDGSLATLFGIAASAGQATGFIGDLTFMHDLSSLFWYGRKVENVLLVVVNNGGGGIFDLLRGEKPAEHDKLFFTPHDVSIEAVCAASGAEYACPITMQELKDVLKDRTSGLRVVEAKVDRVKSLARRADLDAAIDSVLNT